MEVRGPNGDLIASVEDWLQYAPPKRGEFHWADYRSAKELAKAWFRSGVAAVPDEMAELLRSNDHTQAFRATRAMPEVVTRLDDYRGEHRNHDLVVDGTIGDSRIVICVEAKADEPFGATTIASYLEVGSRKPGSRVPDRIRGLADAIFGCSALRSLPEIPYQLLPAVGGTLIEAGIRDAGRAVFFVHEFLHEADPARGLKGTDETKVARNRQALEDLVAALPGSAGRPPQGNFIVGPFHTPGGGRVPSSMPLFVAKCSTMLGPETAQPRG